MSLREKNAWIFLVTTVAVYVPYFAYVYRLLGGGSLRIWPVIGALFTAILVQSVLAAVSAALLTFHQQKEPRDERDAAVEARAYRVAYFMIAALCCTLAIGLPGLLIGLQAAHGDGVFALLLVSQVLLLCYVLAEATRYFTLALGYRRGL